MIQVRPKATEFAGELLKFATKPYRAGRALDGAIDGMIEQLKAEADQPQADDPETAKNKLLLQVEGMKQQTEAAKLKQQGELEAAKMAQADKHKTWELNNQKEIERMKLVKGQQSEQAKVLVQNQKAMTDREAHQAHMFEKQQDIEQKREEFAMTSQLKRQESVARQNDRRMVAQTRLMNPPGGGGRA
jgi:hypothetical protein